MEEVITPDLVAPAPASLISEPGSPIEEWFPTQEDLASSSVLSALHGQFPNASDDILSLAIEQGDSSMATSTAWAASLSDSAALIDTLNLVFPSAPDDKIRRMVISKKHNANKAYVSLA